MAAKIITHAIVADQVGAALIANQPKSAREFIVWLCTLFTAFVGGMRRGRVRFRVDESVGVKATLTLTAVNFANGTVGDRLCVRVPGVGDVYLTAVTGTAGINQYSIDTSNNACATSIAAAINNSPQLSGVLTATPSAATVVCTAFAPGSAGNGIVISKYVTNSAFIASTGPLAGGIDAGALNTAGVTFTITGAVTAGDTLTFGTVVLTAAASPSGESQFVGGVSQDADGAAIAACINAHSHLKGIYSASYGAASSGIVTILCMLEGRALYQTVLAKSCSVGTLSATTFVPPTTDTWVSSTTDYALGAA